MELTRDKSLQITDELWTDLAETGEKKQSWAGWDKYGYMLHYCPLCELCKLTVPTLGANKDCKQCPIYGFYGSLDLPECQCYAIGYKDWDNAETEEDRKRYAKIFLEKLQAIPLEQIPVEEELTKGTEPVYKVVKIRDGKYVSGIAGAPGFAEYPELEYKIGEVTKAPKDSDGIFCIRRYDGARTNANTRDKNLRQGLPTAVLEVYPCGEAVSYKESCRFPAVYVSKELWRQHPAEPEKPEEPVEVDVTAKCKVELYEDSRGAHIDVKHEGNIIMCLQDDLTLKSHNYDYRVEVHKNTSGMFKVYKKS